MRKAKKRVKLRKLTTDEVSLIEKHIKLNTNRLSRLRYGQVEESLWLMGRIEYLRNLLKFGRIKGHNNDTTNT